jgi:hypothetical protein
MPREELLGSPTKGLGEGPPLQLRQAFDFPVKAFRQLDLRLDHTSI